MIVGSHQIPGRIVSTALYGLILAALFLQPSYADGTSLNPAADTYVKQNDTTSHGTETRVLAKAQTGNLRYGYIKFDTSSVSGDLESATLRFTLNNAWPDPGTAALYAFTNNSWTESINWNTKPSDSALGSQLATRSLPVTEGALWEINVTDYVNTQRSQSQTTISFSLRSLTNSNSGIGLFTRESSTSPELVLTVQTTQNQPPQVNAGTDQIIELPDDTVNLNGTVTDDGLPSPPGQFTLLWTKQSGPGNVTFTDATALNTDAAFSQDGEYILRLTADDSELQAFDEVMITVTAVPTVSDEDLLDELQALGAKYFMEKAFSGSGLVLDNSGNPNFSSMAATGFGLAAMPVIAERAGSAAHWTYTYDQARIRTELILDKLLFIQANQSGQENLYGTAGFFYHFVNPQLQRYNNQIEVSIIDTALLLSGALTAGEYFGGTIEQKADQLFDNVDWSFFFHDNFHQFYTGWKPEFGFNGVTFDRYSDEAVLVSLLALRADPGNSAFEESLFNYPRYEGVYGPYTLVHSYYGSLFTYVFAHCFYDFETLGFDQPSGVLSGVDPVDWWRNSISGARANRQFSIDNADTFSSFGPESWGLSATIRPNGSYFGDNGARPADSGNGNAVYDGTMPTAMGIATMPFFKDEDGGVLADNYGFQKARHLYDNFYSNLWGPYGFYASFNHLNQFSAVYLGIELGPLVLMIENYRSRLIWDSFMQDSETSAPLEEVFSYQSAEVPTGNNYSRECEHWTSQAGGVLDFKPNASNGQCLGGGWGRYSSHYATYAIDLIPTNNLVFKLRYASDYGGGWVQIYIDDEWRGQFFAPQTCPVTDGCGWNNFQWGDSVQIGGLSAGLHVLKLKTLGTPFGLNIDIFTLRESTETPPIIETLSFPDGSGFMEGDSGVLNVTSTDPDDDVIEYQFVVNGQVVQPWSTNNTFNLSAYLSTPGIIEVRIQVRDGFGGFSETTVEYAVFRHPIPPPAGG